MRYLRNLEPRIRENAFYVEPDFVDDKAGIQSSKSDKFYIYIWDPEDGKHVRKLVDNNRNNLLS